uniref:non-specific serine/threonine protein kinase n=1 Tax=Fagus sylvatica TaxID=28930 RepID=A0A2N9FA20_FAGSY
MHSLECIHARMHYLECILLKIVRFAIVAKQAFKRWLVDNAAAVWGDYNDGLGPWVGLQMGLIVGELGICGWVGLNQVRHLIESTPHLEQVSSENPGDEALAASPSTTHEPATTCQMKGHKLSRCPEIGRPLEGHASEPPRPAPNRCPSDHLIFLLQVVYSAARLDCRPLIPELWFIPNNKAIIAGVIAGSVAGITVLVGLIAFFVFRRRKGGIGTAKAVEGSLVAFGYRDLQNATKNFSDKLGGGGFGSVFKGTLPDSTVIAVKKPEGIGQGEKQFRTAVSTIGTIQHVNLVRLRGFCSEGIRKLLVYDYMPNGSLDSHLFHEKKTGVLDWKTRYQIVLGTARGLVYLHEKCRDCIIHCDIKPENILLDAELCPKVADFGLAKLVGREFSRVLTTMRGTRGYLAPEWISGVAITIKADVYSYGMMLFELVSGRRNSEQSADGKTSFFPTWAASLIAKGGDVLSLVDPRLEGNADVEEVTRLCRLACWCIQDDETHRPPMGQVVQILEGVLDVNLAPVPRSLQVFVDNQEHIVFFTESSSSQSSQVPSNNSNVSSQSKSSISSTSSKS